MIDFSRYFLPGAQTFLENISYEIQNPSSGKVKMNCKDTIVARVIDPVGIKITFNRALSFNPEGLFYLSVSFSTILRFRSDTKDEIDWKSIDLAGEFRRSGGVWLHNLSSRAALLIAQITSSSGQAPIITVPETAKRSAEETHEKSDEPSFDESSSDDSPSDDSSSDIDNEEGNDPPYTEF